MAKSNSGTMRKGMGQGGNKPGAMKGGKKGKGCK